MSLLFGMLLGLVLAVCPSVVVIGFLFWLGLNWPAGDNDKPV